MDIEAIKKKITKLLALSRESTFEEESHTALQKAQELMMKYKLEQADIADEDKKEVKCIQKKTTLSYGTRSSDHYLDDLAEIIADNFCCINYISTPRGSRTHYICFMGAEDDVEIACEALYAADRFIRKGYDRVYKDICKQYSVGYVPTKYFNPRKRGYVKGYLAGLKEALESQKEQHQEWGLVLVVPKEAQDFKDTLTAFDFSTYDSFRTNDSYYDAGYTDGKDFHLDKKIESAKEYNKLS